MYADCGNNFSNAPRHPPVSKRKERDRDVPDNDKKKKQVPLRLSATLYAEIARWAEAEFRSINGQIEYLLTEAVKKRKKET